MFVGKTNILTRHYRKSTKFFKLWPNGWKFIYTTCIFFSDYTSYGTIRL